jgi:hypothetical protein
VAFPPLQSIAVVTAALVKGGIYINRSCYWSTTFRIGDAIRHNQSCRYGCNDNGWRFRLWRGFTVIAVVTAAQLRPILEATSTVHIFG